MSKNVFLFELDSVRMTDEEIIKAQKTMYDEIVANGNTVVLTYNQVVDSRGFFCLLNNKEYYDSIIRLFELGRIKISQFGDTRTLTQYLLNTLEDEKQFIYSAFPIKNNQKRLMALMKRSLTYTDLCEINEYRENGSRSVEELKDLFIELNAVQITDSNGNQKTELTEQESKLDINTMRLIIENLYWMLSAVMRLSSMHSIYLSPRDRAEYKDLLLCSFLRAAVTIPRTDELWLSSIEIIKQLPAFREESVNRSVYLREIKDAYKSTDCSPVPFQYAEAIINLCYNYTCEASICNTSKHYNTDEIIGSNQIDENTSFYRDFLSRLNIDWSNGENAEKRYLTDESNSFVPLSDTEQIPKKFSRAVRLIEYIKEKDTPAADKTQRYEFNAEQEQKKHKNNIRKKLILKILTVLFFVAVAFVAVILSNDIQNLLSEQAQINGWFIKSALTVAILLITEGITMIIKKWRPTFMTLSDALNGLFIFITDILRITRAKSRAYSNNDDNYRSEAKSKRIPIDYVRTSEIKKYISLFKRRKGNSRLFAPSDICPIYDVENSDVLRSLLRNEEIYHRRYGVIYQSSFNTLLVDPVEDNGKLKPYERMTPSSGYDGVVVIAKHNDSFILLKQFRHALREMQFSFVRGFAECENPVEDVKRELEEEIGVKENDYLSEPRLIGRVAADSGLATTKAYVYCVELRKYNTQVGHEGIQNVIEVSREDFINMIRSGQINDGYTLGAFALADFS